MRRKILFVENSAQEYARFKRLAESNGYEAYQAADYDSALAALAESHYFGVLIEIDAIQQVHLIDMLIRAAKPYSIVMMKGAETRESIICQAFCLGADDFMRTPFSDNIFVARARSVIKRITERRNAHSKSLNCLIDFVPVMMLVSDGDGNISSINEVAASEFGIQRDSCVGRRVCEFLGCEYSQSAPGCSLECSLCKIPQMERETLASGKNTYIKAQKICQMRDGAQRVRLLNLSLAPIEFDGQKLVSIAIEDITSDHNSLETLSAVIEKMRKVVSDSQDKMRLSNEMSDYLKQMNANLSAEKKKLKMLFDNMSSGFILFHRDSQKRLYFDEANAKASESFKMDLSRYFGHEVPDGETYFEPGILDLIGRVLDTGQSESLDMFSEKFSATFRISVYSLVPGSAAVLFSDISDQIRSIEENKMLNKKLMRQNMQLDRSNTALNKAVETKEKFISILAHDLRNPFNAIIGLSEMLIKRLDPDADKRACEIAKVIMDSAKSAHELLENVLSWAKAQQDTIQYQPDDLDLLQVANEAISELKAQAEKKQIVLINQADEGCMIWADRQMLLTIIRNITSNAIKYTQENGLIVIGSQQTSDFTSVIIEDNGVGMTQEVIDKLFVLSKNKSTQGTSGERGTGMGLLITKDFVDKHKGTITVESTVGKGSKFVISFPNVHDPASLDKHSKKTSFIFGI